LQSFRGLPFIEAVRTGMPAAVKAFLQSFRGLPFIEAW